MNQPLLSFFLLISLNAQADFSLRGNVRTLVSADTKSNDPFEHLYSSDTRLFAEGQLKHNAWNGTLSVLSRYSYAGPRDQHTHYEMNLYEAYIRWAHKAFAIEGGERVLRWGVMEYVSPTDAINAHDYRQIVDPDVEDQYLPVPLLRSTYDIHSFAMEVIYQPFFRASRFDLVGTDASVLRPNLSLLLGTPYTDVALKTNDSFERMLDTVVGGQGLPSHNPVTGEGGFRLSTRMAQLELTTLYLSKRDTVPKIDVSGGASALTTATLGSLTASYPRNHLVGATLRQIYNSGITLKAEGLYQPEYTYYDLSLASHRDAALVWAVGADYDAGENHSTYVVEYLEDRLFTDVTSLLLRDRVSRTLSTAVILNFDGQTWTIEVKGTTVLSPVSYLLRPRLLFRPRPEWEFALGGNVFNGPANSLFGLVSNNDELFLSAKYLF